MTKILRRVALAALIGSFGGGAQARDTFLLDVTVPGGTASVGFSKLEDLVDALSDTGLQRLVSTYTQTSAASAVLDVRGLPATASYAARSTALVFTVPDLGITQTFQGATRDESQEMFKQWLRGDGGSVLTQLLRGMVKLTPVDPIAGNPSSLMARMAVADFTMGTQPSPDPARMPVTLIGVDGGFGHYTSRDFSTNVFTLPFTFTRQAFVVNDEATTFTLDVPLMVTDTGGSKAYSGSIGAGLRIPLVKERWSVTPVVRVGVGGSVDLGSAAVIYSASATSRYDLYLAEGNLRLTIGNMLGLLRTASVKAGKYKVDYDLRNTVLRNGLTLEGAAGTVIRGRPTSWQLAVVDTRFFGDDLFVGRYDDIALSFGMRPDPAGGVSWNEWRVGATFTFGEHDYRGFALNVGYRF